MQVLVVRLRGTELDRRRLDRYLFRRYTNVRLFSTDQRSRQARTHLEILGFGMWFAQEP